MLHVFFLQIKHLYLRLCQICMPEVIVWCFTPYSELFTVAPLWKFTSQSDIHQKHLISTVDVSNAWQNSQGRVIKTHCNYISYQGILFHSEVVYTWWFFRTSNSWEQTPVAMTVSSMSTGPGNHNERESYIDYYYIWTMTRMRW